MRSSSEKPSPAELWLSLTYPSLAASWRGACLRAGGAKQHGQVIKHNMHFSSYNRFCQGDPIAWCGLAQTIGGKREAGDGGGGDAEHLHHLQPEGAHGPPLRGLHVRGRQAVPQENFPQGFQVRGLLQKSPLSSQTSRVVQSLPTVCLPLHPDQP